MISSVLDSKNLIVNKKITVYMLKVNVFTNQIKNKLDLLKNNKKLTY